MIGIALKSGATLVLVWIQISHEKDGADGHGVFLC